MTVERAPLWTREDQPEGEWCALHMESDRMAVVRYPGLAQLA